MWKEYTDFRTEKWIIPGGSFSFLFFPGVAGAFLEGSTSEEFEENMFLTFFLYLLLLFRFRTILFLTAAVLIWRQIS